MQCLFDMALRRPPNRRQDSGFTPATASRLLTYVRAYRSSDKTPLPINRTAASRLFAVASRPALSQQTPRVARWQSTVGPNSHEVDNIQSRDEPPSPVHLTKGETKGSEPAAQNTPSHAPNYGAAVDYRTS